MSLEQELKYNDNCKEIIKNFIDHSNKFNSNMKELLKLLVDFQGEKNKSKLMAKYQIVPVMWLKI